MRTPVSRLAAVALFALAVTSCSAFEEWAEQERNWYANDVTGNTLRLTISIGSTNCDRFERIEVTETSTEVNIRNVVSTKTSGGPFSAECVPVDVHTDIDVTLDEPLGDRTLTGCPETGWQGCNPDA